MSSTILSNNVKETFIDSLPNLYVYLYKLYKALFARLHNSLVVEYHFKVEEKTIPKYL